MCSIALVASWKPSKPTARVTNSFARSTSPGRRLRHRAGGRVRGPPGARVRGEGAPRLVCAAHRTRPRRAVGACVHDRVLSVGNHPARTDPGQPSGYRDDGGDLHPGRSRLAVLQGAGGPEPRSRALPAAGAAELRAEYWRRIRALGREPGPGVFVDKLPMASLWTPFIAKVFPDAKILWVRRDPRDVVLSCFRHRFQPGSLRNDLADIERGAALYAGMMQLFERYRARAAAAGSCDPARGSGGGLRRRGAGDVRLHRCRMARRDAGLLGDRQAPDNPNAQRQPGREGPQCGRRCAMAPLWPCAGARPTDPSSVGRAIRLPRRLSPDARPSGVASRLHRSANKKAAGRSPPPDCRGSGRSIRSRR